MFLRCDQGFVNSLVVSMSSNLYGPGMVVLRHQEVANVMFVVGGGICQQNDENGDKVATLEPGSVFNLTALFFPKPSKGSVVAKTYAEVYELPRDRFLQIVEVRG